MVKTIFPLGKPKTFFGAFSASTLPQNLKLEKDGFENFGRYGAGRGF